MTTPLEWADSVGVTFDWRDDWDTGSHVEAFPDAYDKEPSECLVCIAKDKDGNVLAALGCIDEPSAEYSREVESALASEALNSIGAQTFRDVPLFAAREAI